jgi:MFS family permease
MAYGRAYGFERAADNLGAIGGPLLAIGLVAAVGIRAAMLVSVVPGLLAALAIVIAVRSAPKLHTRAHQPIRVRVRPVLHGRLGRILVAVSAFEVGNVAVTLLILRVTELLEEKRGHDRAVTITLLLYVGYNVAATLLSVPGGRLSDSRGPVVVLGAGIGCLAASYAAFALVGPELVVLAVAFAGAGIAIGLIETAQHAAVATFAPAGLRGSAFGFLAASRASETSRQAPSRV